MKIDQEMAAMRIKKTRARSKFSARNPQRAESYKGVEAALQRIATRNQQSYDGLLNAKRIGAIK